jgi:hypothetical protein
LLEPQTAQPLLWLFVVVGVLLTAAVKREALARIDQQISR